MWSLDKGGTTNKIKSRRAGGRGRETEMIFSFEHVQCEMPTGPEVENAQPSGKEIYILKSLI